MEINFRRRASRTTAGEVLDYRPSFFVDLPILLKELFSGQVPVRVVRLQVVWTVPLGVVESSCPDLGALEI